jgi:hypothetical protein
MNINTMMDNDSVKYSLISKYRNMKSDDVDNEFETIKMKLSSIGEVQIFNNGNVIKIRMDDGDLNSTVKDLLHNIPIQASKNHDIIIKKRK